MTYSLDKLQMLESWLDKKLSSMGGDIQAGDDYSEVNLTKAILSFVQDLVKRERELREPFRGKPDYWYTPGPTYNPHYPSYTPYPNIPSIDPLVTQQPELICSECKAKNPHMTCCIHRITLNTSTTTGE